VAEPPKTPAELPEGLPPPLAAEGALGPGAVQRVLSRGLVRAGIVTYLFSGATLVANLVTGVITARALGPGGRGVTVALLTLTQLIGFLFAAGAMQSLSYFVARRPEDAPRLLTTWSLMLLPSAVLAIAIGELLLPVLFEAGSDALTVGRWFMFAIVLVLGVELYCGLLLGLHDFLIYNALRLAQPLLTALAFIVLWPLDALTVESALIATSLATIVSLAVGFGRIVARAGAGPPDLRLGARSLWFGIRGQGSSVATNLTARLDVAMLPGYVSNANVGIYSVATNVSLIVYALANTFSGLVLPSAAREPERAPLKVIGSLWAVLLTAGAMALALGLLAEPLLGLVYGEDFEAAARSLRLLLPGAVLFAGSSILTAGIYAAGYPFAATLTQLLGMAATVIGLVVFLPSGGITAAALVSSASYTLIFIASLVAYRALAGVPWSHLLPTPARLRALAR
jgi:O-antigen/teichoic acid export membrane protein